MASHAQSVMELKGQASGRAEKLKSFHLGDKLEAVKYIPKVKIRPASVMDLAVL